MAEKETPKKTSGRKDELQKKAKEEQHKKEGRRDLESGDNPDERKRMLK